MRRGHALCIIDGTGPMPPSRRIVKGRLMRSLWFKLFIAFTVLSIFGITMLEVLTSTYFSYRDFKRVFVPETVADIVRSRQLLFSEAVKNPENPAWLALIGKELHGDALNITSDDGDFSIRHASNPEIYYEIRDASGVLFTRYPSVFPDEVAEEFKRQHAANRGGTDVALSVGRKRAIWVCQSLVDDRAEISGRMDLLMIAQFNLWDVVERAIVSCTDSWHIMAFIFSAVGALCGLVANWFVTGRLKDMSVIAAGWSAGDFSPRIPVDEKNDDILAQHSRTLNGMAGQLEGLIELRQKTAVDEERNRVARELHDTVKQNLFALKLQLAAIRRKNASPEAMEHIEEAQKITNEAQHDIANILTQLAPDASGGGVYARLDALSENMRRRFGVKTIWERREKLRTTPGEEQVLFRIMQEAMNNAVRHGRATVVTMNAYAENGVKCLSLTDNGSGLTEDTEKKRTGMGLVFMRERAGELPEGAFSIMRNGKEGTTVRITWRGN